MKNLAVTGDRKEIYRYWLGAKKNTNQQFRHTPNKHRKRRQGGKYVSTFGKAKEQNDGIVLKCKTKFREVESNDGDSDFEYYVKSVEKPVFGDLSKEITAVAEGTQR